MLREPRPATAASQLGKGGQAYDGESGRPIRAGHCAIRTLPNHPERQRPRDIRGMKLYCQIRLPRLLERKNNLTSTVKLAQRAASPKRYSRVISSSSLLSSSVITNSAAARLASSCSGRLAPTIGAVTVGFASTHATERVTRETPSRRASLRSASTVANSRSCQYRFWYSEPASPRVKRDPSVGTADRLCLPESRPPAIGL